MSTFSVHWPGVSLADINLLYFCYQMELCIVPVWDCLSTVRNLFGKAHNLWQPEKNVYRHHWGICEKMLYFDCRIAESIHESGRKEEEKLTEMIINRNGEEGRRDID